MAMALGAQTSFQVSGGITQDDLGREQMYYCIEIVGYWLMEVVVSEDSNQTDIQVLNNDLKSLKIKYVNHKYSTQVKTRYILFYL